MAYPMTLLGNRKPLTRDKSSMFNMELNYLDAAASAN